MEKIDYTKTFLWFSVNTECRGEQEGDVSAVGQDDQGAAYITANQKVRSGVASRQIRL